MASKLIITDVGLDKMVRADQSGTDSVAITKCVFGSGKWSPTSAATALLSPFSWSLTTVSGGAVAGNQIHIEVTDGSTRSYSAYEVGLYDSAGDLLAIASQTKPIMTKAAASTAMITFDVALENLDVENISFGDTTYVNPSATESREGVAEVATQAEVTAGTDDARFVTPKKLAAWIAGVLAPYFKTSLLLDRTYPVGSIYMSVTSTSPATLFGGTWTRITDTFLYCGASSGTYAPGKSGGAKTATIGTANLPAHSHPVTADDAGGIAAAKVTTTSAGKHDHAFTGTAVAGHMHTVTLASATPAMTFTGTAVAAHTHTQSACTTAGSHAHEPGTMKIDGTIAASGMFDKGSGTSGEHAGPTATGAFSWDEKSAVTHGDSEVDGTTTRQLVLQADATHGWTGSTSTVAGHTHTVTLKTAGAHTPAGTISGGAHTHTQSKCTTAGGHTPAGTIATAAAHTHSVTIPAIAAHTHAMTCANTGSGTALGIMPPWLAVYVWKRTA